MVADCAFVRKLQFTAREVLSHKALNCKPYEPGKQEPRDREEFGRKSEKLERAVNELKAFRNTIARLERVVQGYKRIRRMERGTEKKRK